MSPSAPPGDPEKGQGGPGAQPHATSGRLAAAIALIDAANAADPERILEAGEARPAALVYGRRMSAALAEFRPDASELLQIAVRGSHVERWKIPRASYPEGRAGYLRWRADLGRYHAERVAGIMRAVGYDAADCARTGAHRAQGGDQARPGGADLRGRRLPRLPALVRGGLRRPARAREGARHSRQDGAQDVARGAARGGGTGAAARVAGGDGRLTPRGGYWVSRRSTPGMIAQGCAERHQSWRRGPRTAPVRIVPRRTRSTAGAAPGVTA